MNRDSNIATGGRRALRAARRVLRRGPVGGSANEIGSLFRAGIATHVSSYLLAGRAVDHLTPEPKFVRELVFETDSAVDDLELRCTDDSTLWVQAKHSVGLDQTLIAAINQFVEAHEHGELREDDRLVVAYQEGTGSVRQLAKALENEHSATLPPLTRRQRDALTWLRRQYPTTWDDNTRDFVEARIRIVKVEATRLTDQSLREASVLLEGLVVPQGYGKEAAEAIRAAAQRIASVRGLLDLDALLAILRSSHIQIISDAGGSPAAARQAIVDDIERYRVAVKSWKDRLQLSLVADELGDLHHTHLLDGYTVAISRESDSDEARNYAIADVARRWGSFLLLGLPGSGKSTALSQLAALWASDEGAPLPVPVRLRQLSALCRRTERPFTIRELLDQSVEYVGVELANPGRLAIENGVRDGSAALFLDGLDECGAQRGRIVTSIQSIIDEVPHLRVFLSSRASAETAAVRLGLPAIELNPPGNLQEVLSSVIDVMAQAISPPREVEAWAAQRKRQLPSGDSLKKPLWGIPLYGTLMTVLLCRGTRFDNRAPAPLLVTALKDAVDREAARDAHPERYEEPRRPYPAELLLAFRIIGHRLANGEDSLTTIRHELATQLRRDSTMGAAEAAYIAESTISYWDTRGGVFLIEEESVRARSKVFMDLADAEWIASDIQPEDRLPWLTTRGGQGDQHEAIKYAASLNSDIAAAYLGQVEYETSDDASRLALALLEQETVSDPTLRERVFEALVCRARAHRDSPNTDAQETDVQETDAGAARARWTWLERLASLELPTEVRPRRRAILEELPGDERVVAAAMAALADCIADQRALTDAEEASVRAALALSQLVARTEPAYRSTRGRFKVLGRKHPLSHSLSMIAKEAVKALSEVTQEDLTHIESIRDQSGGDEYFAIGYRAEQRGLPLDPLSENLTSTMSSTIATVSRAAQALDDAHIALLDALAEGAEPVPDSQVGEGQERWTADYRDWALEDVANLCEALDLNTGDYRETLELAEHADKVVRYRDILAEAGEAEKLRVLRQARFARTIPVRDASDIMSVPPRSGQGIALEPAGLGDDSRAFLIDCIVLGPDALRYSAMPTMLGQLTQAEIEWLQANVTGSPLIDRPQVGIFLLHNLGDGALPLASEWLATDDIGLRFAGASYVASEGTKDQSAPLVADEDLTIRSVVVAKSNEHTHSSEVPAHYWSCRYCATKNMVEQVDCTMCSNGRRPKSYAPTPIDEMDF